MKHITLYKRMYEFAPKFYGEKTVNQVMYWARKMLKPYNVKVNRIIDKENKICSGATVGGFYDPTLEFGDKDIEMFIMFNANEPKVDMTESLVHTMMDELFKTLVHEKRHRYQFKKRGLNYGPQYKCRIIADDNLRKELEYYGDPDEVDAYAQEAAIEVRLHGHSDTFAKYKELFDKHDKKVYNSFLKKQYKFLNRITL